MKRRLLPIIEGWFRVEYMLYAFWAMFWLLNGLDKFFNGTPKTDPRFGNYVEGWFGVNRDAKMIHYFERLHMPDWLAIVSLYGFAVLEVIVGALFVWILIRPGTDKIVHRIAFKLSLVVFFVFMAGDILFGDRMELWEHGTFLIMTVITFQLYLGRGLVRQDVMGLPGPRGDSELPSTVEFNEFLRWRETQEWAARNPGGAARAMDSTSVRG
jgi:hypothetical protein